jgi:hypothetical protein
MSNTKCPPGHQCHLSQCEMKPILLPNSNPTYAHNILHKPALFIQLLLLLLLLLTGTKIYAQRDVPPDSTNFHMCHSEFEAGAEFLIHTRYRDDIQTISLNAFFWKPHFKNISMIVNIGLTATYSWGYTTQVKISRDSFSVATDYKTSGFGLGPVIQINPTIIKAKRFSLVAEASGGIMLYMNRFPYGGDIYNFMFRSGASIIYPINSVYFLKIGYRWMHVSNGKGTGIQNPFFEGHGLNISFLKVK